MSATLDAEALAARLRTDAVVKVEAERHPVTISYRPPEPGEDLTDAAAAAVVDAVGSDAHAGDLLVFLPGVGAITRVERSVRRALGSRLDDELVVMPLHGRCAAMTRTRRCDATRTAGARSCWQLHSPKPA